MDVLIRDWLLYKLTGEFIFWGIGALMFRWVCVEPMLRHLASIDESLKCLPAVREMRAAAYRRQRGAA